MSLSNPYTWVADLPPRARRRVVMSVGWSVALVGLLTAAAVLVPAGTGNAAPAPPDYVAGGGPCTDTTFYLASGSDADGTPATYYRYSFRYSYEIGGAPGSRYYRYVHGVSTWNGTGWQSDPAAPTVETWYCLTRSPVPATPAPTPTPTDSPAPSDSPAPTDSPPPTPGPTDPTPPPGRDCGNGQGLTGDQLTQLIAQAGANGATPEQVSDLAANPCEVLAGLLDGLEIQDPLILADDTWQRTTDGHVCGTIQLRFPFKFRYAGWRGWPFGNVTLDDTVATISVRQYLCKDQLGVVLDNGSAVDYSDPNQPKATAPPNPEVEVNVTGFTWLMGISKGGLGNSGVSNAYWAAHNGHPKAGWRSTIELELTLLGAGGGGGFAAWKKVYTQTFVYTVDDIPNV